jgi:glycosyltransferase involved in cell wall biosynthesis
MKIVLITPIPSPYIVTFCNEIGKRLGDSFLTIYSAVSLHMKWENTDITHHYIQLDSKKIFVLKNTYFIDSTIWNKLKDFNPDVIVTCGFQIPMLYGILFAYYKRRKFFIMSDSWALKEMQLTVLHKLVRKIVYKNASGFFPVSVKGKLNFQSYGIESSKIHIVPYVIDVEKYARFSHIPFDQRPYDILFSGQFIDRKMPMFFIEVACKLKIAFPELKILLIGSGPLEYSILEKAKSENLNLYYPGFIQPADIPLYYAKAKVLLFTTSEDSWGVVANEAIATATPVIVTPYAGASDEIVLNGENGYVLPVNSDVWVEKIIGLLSNTELYKKFQEKCFQITQSYTPSFAGDSFLNGINGTFKL